MRTLKFAVMAILAIVMTAGLSFANQPEAGVRNMYVIGDPSVERPVVPLPVIRNHYSPIPIEELPQIENDPYRPAPIEAYPVYYDDPPYYGPKPIETLPLILNDHGALVPYGTPETRSVRKMTR